MYLTECPEHNILEEARVNWILNGAFNRSQSIEVNIILCMHFKIANSFRVTIPITDWTDTLHNGFLPSLADGPPLVLVLNTALVENAFSSE